MPRLVVCDCGRDLPAKRFVFTPRGEILVCAVCHFFISPHPLAQQKATERTSRRPRRRHFYARRGGSA